MQMQPLNYLKDCLESRRFALDDHYDCALFWCALSGPRNWALHDWSKVWPTLTWLTKLVGVAVSSSIRNKNFTHSIKPATYGRVWDNLLALTHWGRNKMVHILQTPLPNAFSLNQNYCIFWFITSMFVPQGPVDNRSSLNQVMPTTHYMNQSNPRFVAPDGVINLQLQKW